MSGAVGFACHWDRHPEGTWSGTPWRLRAALAALTTVHDMPVGPPVPARAVLKAMGMRRANGRWQSLWRHGRVTTGWVERDLRRAAERSDVRAVVQVQDLGLTPQPFLMVQDLSYHLLMAQSDGVGVPHFRTLGRDRILGLMERQQRLYEAAAGLLPMSRWLADDLVASGVPADRVTVVNPGVNVETRTGPVPVRRGSPTRKLLMVGRDFDTKAGDQVVAAFGLLRRELGPGITLTIMGPPTWPLPGPPPPGVDFRGPRPRQEVAEAIESHDLFVMPSRFEGFGIAFVEALGRGLPCIGRRACAMPEIIDPQSGGRLVETEEPQELADVIVEALADDDLYAACAAEAPRRREHYTWDRAAAQVLAAVDDLG
jgi:glycosyltransferase involved in cell wall biosynthesis